MIDPLANELSSFDALKKVKADRDGWLKLFQESDPAKSAPQENLGAANTKDEKSDSSADSILQNDFSQELISTEETLEALTKDGHRNDAEVQATDSQNLEESVKSGKEYLDKLANNGPETANNSKINFGYLASGELVQVSLPEVLSSEQVSFLTPNFPATETRQIPIVQFKSGLSESTTVNRVSLKVHITISSVQQNAFTTAASKHSQVASTQAKVVTFKAEQSWQQRKMTVIESDSALKLYLRDYRLSNNEKVALYQGLLEEFSEQNKVLEITINGQRKI